MRTPRGIMQPDWRSQPVRRHVAWLLHAGLAGCQPPCPGTPAQHSCFAGDNKPVQVIVAATRGWRAGNAPQCQVYFYPKFFDTSTPNYDPQATIVHELTHCAEGLAVANVQAYGNIPSWVAERVADRVAGKMLLTFNQSARKWDEYLGSAGSPLHRMSNEAMGFWWELDYRGIDVWKRFIPVVRASADAKAGHSDAAFTTALGNSADDIRQSWPVSYTRASTHGLAWTTNGTRITGTKARFARPIPVGNSTSAALRSPPLAVGLTALNVTAEVLRFTSDPKDAAGGRFGPGGAGDFVFPAALSTVFCTMGADCKCPEDTPGAGTRFQSIAGGRAFLGITAGVKAGAVGFTGTSLKAFCGPAKQKPAPGTGSGPSSRAPVPKSGCQPPGPPRPRPAPAGDAVRAAPVRPVLPHREGESCGTGGSNGDPHLVTFDNLRYDLQSVGEFTLARSPADGLLVQARQKACPGLTTASINGALAANVAGDRVGLYLTDGPEVIEVHLNGVTIAPPAGDTALPHGGVLTRQGEGATTLYSVVWPDGSRLHVSTIGAVGLRADVVVPSARRGRMEGLLGNFDGRPDDDLDMGAGNTLAVPARPDDLHGPYADRWRITQEASLFDYAPGQSTATFTNRRFPTPPTALAARDRADATCRGAGVTDPELVEDCVFDVASTGRKEFAAATAAQKAFQAATRRTAPTDEKAPDRSECRAEDNGDVTTRFTLIIGDTEQFGSAFACTGFLPAGSPRYELRFASEAGQKTHFNHLPGGECPFRWRLYGGVDDERKGVAPLLPAVSICQDLGLLTLPETSTYVIVVDKPDPALSGTYGFRLTTR
ncbi:VWD domain-containing protein [Embleya sp. NPDC008237]|uniref:VWD domain-containing protein n=1 Tax=Embleya sp. NPDC008237 TaxID=3363978 RepID=UPI0036F15E48